MSAGRVPASRKRAPDRAGPARLIRAPGRPGRPGRHRLRLERSPCRARVGVGIWQLGVDRPDGRRASTPLPFLPFCPFALLPFCPFAPSVATTTPTRRGGERSERTSAGRVPASRKRAPDEQYRRRPDLPAATHDARGASWRPGHIGPAAPRPVSAEERACGESADDARSGWGDARAGAQSVGRKGDPGVSGEWAPLRRSACGALFRLPLSRSPNSAGRPTWLVHHAPRVGRWALALSP